MIQDYGKTPAYLERRLRETQLAQEQYDEYVAESKRRGELQSIQDKDRYCKQRVTKRRSGERREGQREGVRREERRNADRWQSCLYWTAAIMSLLDCSSKDIH